ncbi:hypothetical protein OROGR_008468 [Orobanche gracilis]
MPHYLETGEESLAAVAGMFSSKAKGIEWSLDTDASNATVLVASEAHAISLAIEGLLGVVFAVATLTDEAVDDGELGSPRCDTDLPTQCSGITAALCMSMVDSTWLTILDALSLILMKSQGEAIILEILKGYQAFTQACGVLRAVEPLNSFLASLCKFTIYIPNEAGRGSVILSPSSKRAEQLGDQRESIVLTSKNVQALRTLFNIAHRLHNVLGPSWVLVLETLSALDRKIHSSHATTQWYRSIDLGALVAMFPIFDGSEAWGWLISVEQYCEAKGIAEEKKFSEAEKSLCGSEPYMPEPRPIPESPEQEKMEENGVVLEKESEANLYVPEPVQDLGEEEISAEDDQTEREAAAIVAVGEPDSEAATEKREKIVLVPLMEIRPSTGEMRDAASRVESQKRISQRAGKDDSSADLPQIGTVGVDKESRSPPKSPNPFPLEAETNTRPPAKPPDLVRAVEVK